MLGMDNGTMRSKTSVLQLGGASVIVPNQRGEPYTLTVIHKS